MKRHWMPGNHQPKGFGFQDIGKVNGRPYITMPGQRWQYAEDRLDRDCWLASRKGQHLRVDIDPLSQKLTVKMRWNRLQFGHIVEQRELWHDVTFFDQQRYGWRGAVARAIRTIRRDHRAAIRSVRMP